MTKKSQLQESVPNDFQIENEPSANEVGTVDDTVVPITQSDMKEVSIYSSNYSVQISGNSYFYDNNNKDDFSEEMNELDEFIDTFMNHLDIKVPERKETSSSFLDFCDTVTKSFMDHTTENVVSRVRYQKDIVELVKNYDMLADVLVHLGNELKLEIPYSKLVDNNKVLNKVLKVDKYGKYTAEELARIGIYASLKIKRWISENEKLKEDNIVLMKQQENIDDELSQLRKEIRSLESQLSVVLNENSQLKTSTEKLILLNNEFYVLRHTKKEGRYIYTDGSDDVYDYESVDSINKATKFKDINKVMGILKELNDEDYNGQIKNPHRYVISKIVLMDV